MVSSREPKSANHVQVILKFIYLIRNKKFMAFIEFYKGCGGFKGCFGPDSSYITVFGTEYWFLIPHFVISLFIGLILLTFFYNLKKKEKIKLSPKVISIISIATIILMFFILAFLFPFMVLH